MRKWLAVLVVFTFLFSAVGLKDASAAKVNKHYTVQVSKLNVYEKATPKAYIVGSLSKGQVVFVYETLPGGWAKIKYNGQAGYVATSGFKAPSQAAQSFRNYHGLWSTPIGIYTPYVEADLNFQGSHVAYLTLQGMYMPNADGTGGEMTWTNAQSITFNKSGIAKANFVDFHGSKGVATVSLKGSRVHLNIKYSSSTAATRKALPAKSYSLTKW